MWYSTRLVGTQGKLVFLGRPWAKVAGRDPEYVFLGIRQRFVARDRGQATGVRPHGCCRGTMWVPLQGRWYPGKTRFLGRLWVQVLGGVVVTTYEHGYDPSVA